MGLITITVSTYIATKIADHFITNNGYNFLQRLLFPKKKYVDRLYQIIEETALEQETNFPCPTSTTKIPFYKSKVVFDLLNQYILFTQPTSLDQLISEIEDNNEIITPKINDIKYFYENLYTKINNCDILKDFYIEENYKDKVYEIGNSILDLQLLLESIDKKLTFTLNDNWLTEKCDEACSDLGSRYTPELNVELEVSNIFNGIGRTSDFKKSTFEIFDSFAIKSNKLKHNEFKTSPISRIESSTKKILDIYSNFELESIEKIPVESLLKNLENCLIEITNIENNLLEKHTKADTNEQKAKLGNKYATPHRLLREFEQACSTLIEYLNSSTIKLASNPFLLLEGEAGIGKSHLLADTIKSRQLINHPSIFILGQHLTTNEAPWTQILKRLEINTTSENFLIKLNLHGERKGRRLIIFIDAINEGAGNKFWPDHINSFIDSIKKYKWLGVILSIRTTYKNVTISSSQVERNNFINYRHIGFTNIEQQAINMFFDNFKIDRPSSPLLNPEYRNPLYLKLLCEGIKKSGLNKVPKGLDGLTSTLNFFIAGINKSLSSVNQHNYNPKLNLVSKSINELVKTKVESGKTYIQFDTAFLVVHEAVGKYISDRNFLNSLINEGLLTTGVIRNSDEIIEIVYISFERFDDHLSARYLLKDVQDIVKEFSQHGKLHYLFKDRLSLHLNQGLIEALSIQIPEIFGLELYELAHAFKDDFEFIMAFINSLVWRSPDSIDNEKIKKYINNEVFQYTGTFSHFLEIVISLSSVDNHPYNADSLHSWLSKQSLPDRDAEWTIELKDKYSENSTFKGLIDWAWSSTDKSHIADRQIELSSTTLCWFLASSNRKLRDCTTKALVNLLENRIEVLLTLINKFKDVDDPYILERIYAVALGCTLRTIQTDKLKDLAELVYTLIFDKKQVYPHALLRDYAREIIEYANILNISLDGVDMQKTTPPYESAWPEDIPSKDNLKELYDRDNHYHLWSSIMGSGDFSRYTIGTNGNSSSWSGVKFGEKPINRDSIYTKFKNSLTPEQKNLFNNTSPFTLKRNSEKNQVDTPKFKRSNVVGRKTDSEVKNNKIIFEASLNTDQLSLYRVEIKPYLSLTNTLLNTDSHFDLKLAQRFIFNRVIDLGWSPNLHLEFDRGIGTGRGRRNSYQERIGKKYQWIAYHEFIARLSDNFIRYEKYSKEENKDPYIGPWDPYTRDIDPTILLHKTGELSNKDGFWWNINNTFNWDCSFEEWISNKELLEDPTGLIEVQDPEGNKWLVLESQQSWTEPKIMGYEEWSYPRKEIWCHINSYLVKENEIETFSNWLPEQHFMGRWMPEGSNRYQLFDREYYWSIASSYFQTEYFGEVDWEDIKDKETDEYIAKVSHNSITYLWEEEFDYSKSEVLTFLKPSSLLCKKMLLKPGKEAGTFTNETGEVVCFSAEALHDSKPHLLVRKDDFLTMLKKNKLKVAWTLLGEKGVIGGLSAAKHNFNRVEFSGSFLLQDDNIKGQYRTF